MPFHTRTGVTVRAAIFLGVVATLSVPLAVGAASASEGSVPAEVSAWASDPAGLVASLDDLVGVGGDGKGIDFGEDATTVGQLNRVFTFTSDFLAGVATETPVERQNEWTAPISVSEKLIGLATIWIDPDTIQPDLADFVQGASLPESFVDVAADSYLVHDVDRGAWFTLTGDSLTVLVPGSSGVSATTPLTVYQGLISTRAAAVPTPAPTVNSGIVTSIIIIGVAIVGVVGIMIAAQLRANRRPASNPVDVAAPTTTQPEAIAAAAAPAEVTAPVVAATPKKTPAKPAATKPAAAKPTAAKPAAATPATPKKPTATKPAAAKAPATKPAAVKPATAKPSTPKPGTAAKPATAKPATAKPATAKPPRAKPTPAKPATAKPPSAKPATVRTTATAPAAASTRAPAKPRTPKPKPDAPTA